MLLPSCLVNPVPTPGSAGTSSDTTFTGNKQDASTASDASADAMTADAIASADVKSDVGVPAVATTGPVAATATDAAIAEGEHLYAVAPEVLSTGKLVVLLPDADAVPSQYATIAMAAAHAGHRVLVLAAPVAALAACAGDSNCLELARKELFDGQDRTPKVTVDMANSLQNRLVKALAFLDKQRPGENWGSFYNGSTPYWASIAIAGHGEGASEAAMVAMQQSTWRVVLLGGPTDGTGVQAANWLAGTSQTDKSAWRAFAATNDSAWAVIGAAWTALGLGSSSAQVSIDSGAKPTNSTQLLTTATNVPDPHGAVAQDGALPVDAVALQHLSNAWTLLFWPY
jgi:hypothetical protein